MQRSWYGVVTCTLVWLAPSVGAQQSIRAAQALPYLRVSAGHTKFEWFYLVLDIGRATGIWKKHDLEFSVRPVAATADDLIREVADGTQLGLANTAEVLLAQQRGAHVRIVAAYFGPTSAKIFVKPDSRLERAADLDGRRIGVLSETHTSFRAVGYLNHLLGVNAKPVVVGGLEGGMRAVASDDVDALYSAEGAAMARVRAGDLRVLVSLAEIYPKPYAAVVAWAAESEIRRRPDEVRRFVSALLEIVGFIRHNEKLTADYYQMHTMAPRDVAEAAAAQLTEVLTQEGKGSGTTLLAAVEGSWLFTRDSGAAPAIVSMRLSEAVDSSFLPRE